MTGTLDFLIDVCEMAPLLIKLPDGRYTSSTKYGRVVLGSSLRLQEVLFVDGLKCHLISQENGLYFFRGVDTKMATVQAMESLPADVWHRRLGHPSSKALEIGFEFPFANSSLSSQFSPPETSSSPFISDDFGVSSPETVTPPTVIPSSSCQLENTNSQPVTTTTQPETESPTETLSSEVSSSSTSSDNEQHSDYEIITLPVTTESLPVYRPEPEPLGVGKRPKKLPTKLSDYVLMLLHDPPPTNTHYPLDNFV
ncbi:unnamed protein product, partial [Arabidopsis halleri]